MPVSEKKDRIQVIVSKEMAMKIDLYSSKMGLSRSALCCQFIGQGILAYDKAFDVVDKMANQLAEGAGKEVAAVLDK